MVTKVFLLRHAVPSISLAMLVTGVLQEVMMLSMSMSSSLLLMSGANFPLVDSWNACHICVS